VLWGMEERQYMDSGCEVIEEMQRHPRFAG
jgi:hypothetical protein